MKWKKTFLRYEILFLPIWKSGCHIIWRLQIVLVHYSIRWWDWHIIHLMVHLVSCFLFPPSLSSHPSRLFLLQILRCLTLLTVWHFGLSAKIYPRIYTLKCNVLEFHLFLWITYTFTLSNPFEVHSLSCTSLFFFFNIFVWFIFPSPLCYESILLYAMNYTKSMTLGRRKT